MGAAIVGVRKWRDAALPTSIRTSRQMQRERILILTRGRTIKLQRTVREGMGIGPSRGASVGYRGERSHGARHGCRGLGSRVEGSGHPGLRLVTACTSRVPSKETRVKKARGAVTESKYGNKPSRVDIESPRPHRSHLRARGS